MPANEPPPAPSPAVRAENTEPAVPTTRQSWFDTITAPGEDPPPAAARPDGDQAYVPPPAPATPDVPIHLDVPALRESAALIDGVSDAVASEFYATLFSHYPMLRDLFPAGMEVQRSRLVGALVRIVGTATSRPQLTDYLADLGRDHRKFGVISQHYGPVGVALVTALRRTLGPVWTERFDAAWVEAYDLAARVMIEAANQDSLVNPPWWDAEVVMHRRVLDDMAVIQVRPHTVYPYRPGQYCYLTTPRRPNMWRAFSIATAPRDDSLLEFHVRAIGAGWVSSALVWRTEPGDVLRIGAPQGTDVVGMSNGRDLLCIAGGTGIAPVLAGVQDIAIRQAKTKVHVFYAGIDRESLYALPHLEAIGLRYHKLTVVPVISPDGDSDRSPDVMGNIVAAYGDWRQHAAFVAGPTTMVGATLSRLREQGIPETQLRCDDYGLW